MFWVWMLVATAVVVGLTVLFARIAGGGTRRVRGEGRRDEQVMALKASGALKHRKSNRP